MLRDIMAIVDADDEQEAAQRFRREANEDDKKCKRDRENVKNQ